METEENKWIQNSVGGVDIMGEDWSLEIVRTLDKMLPFLERITLALEQTTRVLTAWGTARITPFPNMKVGGEKSVATIEGLGSSDGKILHESQTDSKPSEYNYDRESKLDDLKMKTLREKTTIDSNPWPKESSSTTATTVVESQNFVDVRECIVYSDKAYKLVGYDNKETYIAKQHVVRTESLEGGGTRVIVSEKSAWAISKLEWK